MVIATILGAVSDFDEKVKLIINPEKRAWKELNLTNFIIINFIVGAAVGFAIAIVLFGLPMSP